ncbi:pre-rRNA-processing protein esf1-like [Asparagus officinalis]|uniref:pre-rRNA-processing protein esf1-like n=1 Tax=Asparagus officinalis TaxID=4686 RepID=UPI00098E7FEC|nr:pre-rRNA-processing protein esf1-like [Asparagus officinalis]
MVGTRSNGNPSSGNGQMPEADPQQLLAMIQGLVTNQQFLAGHLQQEPQHQHPPRSEPGVREFRYMRPPSFTGADGPLAAEEFLKVTETILTVTRIPPAEWVDLMDVQLTDTARIWWAAKKTHLERPIMWETFTDRFNRKYFPQSARDELLRRFVELKQGGRSVDEYEAEFSSLSRYAPHLVTDPTIRRHQFQKGLDKYIRMALAGRALATHDAVLDAAREIESVHKEPEDSHVIQKQEPVAPVRKRCPLQGAQQQSPQRQPSILSCQPFLRVTVYQTPSDYYYGVVVFDSVATASHIYKNLDGTELLRTSNVFDLRFIPDSMEFKHPPRDMTAEPPTSYNVPDFHTRALQHSKVNLTWEEDEPNRTKFLKRKFNTDQLDELNEYLASSDSDASDEEEEIDGSENEDAGALPDGKSKKHMHKEKLRALLLSGDGSGSDKDDDEDNDQEMEITFNTGLEDLSKRILEKKDKKSETVWEQVLRKRSEKRKARKNRSKYSDDDDDDSDSDVQEATDQPDDFFMEEEPSDSDAEVADKKKGDSKKSKKGKSSRKERKKSLDEYKDQEVSKAELELLFAEDQDGKGQNAKGYKIKLKKGKGKKGKEESLEAKLPDVDPSSDPRFSALFNSHLFALDPTDPQFKRSAAYARQKLGKQKIVKKTGQSEETANVPEQVEISNNDPKKKEKYELSSTVQSLKRNLGNLKKGTRSR